MCEVISVIIASDFHIAFLTLFVFLVPCLYFPHKELCNTLISETYINFIILKKITHYVQTLYTFQKHVIDLVITIECIKDACRLCVSDT